MRISNFGIVSAVWGGLIPVLSACLPVSAVDLPNAEVTLASRMAEDNTFRTVALEIRGISGQVVDEVRLDLPRDSASKAAPQQAPSGWKLERDGHWLRFTGPVLTTPLRLSFLVFDAGEMHR